MEGINSDILTGELAGAGYDCLDSEGQGGAGATSEGSGLRRRAESVSGLTETGVQVGGSGLM